MYCSIPLMRGTDERLITLFKAVIIIRRLLLRYLFYLKSQRGVKSFHSPLKSRRRLVDAFNSTLIKKDEEVTLPLPLAITIGIADITPSKSPSPFRKAKVHLGLSQKLDTIIASREMVIKSAKGVHEEEEPKLASVLEKNEAIESSSGTHSTQKAFDFVAGRELYFGCFVALQGRHGGFLSFQDESSLRASAPSILHHSKFTLLNAENVGDAGLLRYGNAILLQMGEFEVLGTHYNVESDGTVVPFLCVINTRGDNLHKAISFGKWIILNRADPLRSIGNVVGHLDSIILEKEWHFLCSSSPAAPATLLANGSFEQAVDRNKDKILQLLRPRNDCVWRLNLVSLPDYSIKEIKDSGGSASKDLMTCARKQLDQSGEIRHRTGTLLNQVTGEFNQTKAEEFTGVALFRNAAYKKKTKAAVMARMKICERPPYGAEKPKKPIKEVKKGDVFEKISLREVYDRAATPLMLPSKQWLLKDNFLAVKESPQRLMAANIIIRFMVKYLRKFSYSRFLLAQRERLDVRLLVEVQKEKRRKKVEDRAAAFASIAMQKIASMERISRQQTFASLSSLHVPKSMKSSTLEESKPLSPATMMSPPATEQHWSRRAKIDPFKKPLSFAGIKVPGLQKDRRKAHESLRFLKTTSLASLFSDLHIVRSRRAVVPS